MNDELRCTRFSFEQVVMRDVIHNLDFVI